ncbi:protein phosphatase 1 regulatory subunit 36-like [Lycorma delicatula]|uniref:protein phosphatase 1 regulatory subunit 36-like n=1 Tax=Lycorma delicatula TaxID=130591 RepID=UPI003F51580B
MLNNSLKIKINGDKIIRKATSSPSSISRGSCDKTSQHLKLKFLEVLDYYEQIQFRRHFMRKSKLYEKDVVILQDIKDVVFYLLLTPVPFKFIRFFHTAEVDNFLRGLILYFQYFLEIWDDVQYRCQNVKKLKHPVGIEREMVVTQNLSQLRCIVARDYFLILLGAGSCKRFHHLSNKQNKSMGDRDFRLLENLFFFSIRVVWIALMRNNMSIIEVIFILI